MKPKTQKCSYQGSGAFTLMELLVTITIIIILVGIALSALGGAMNIAKRTECMHNMRQIGTALNLYIAEHENLPHCWVSTPYNPVTCDPDSFGPLSAHLAPYLGKDDVPEDTSIVLDVFQCPAFPNRMSEQEALAASASENWQITYRLVLGKEGGKNLFGGSPTSEPIHLLRVENELGHPGTRIPVLFDMDKELGFYHGESTPDTPVHKSGRNVLYLDGHVAFEKDLTFLEDFR